MKRFCSISCVYQHIRHPIAPHKWLENGLQGQRPFSEQRTHKLMFIQHDGVVSVHELHGARQMASV